ncbi:MAG: Fic family protein [bacterium]|nr:Fic family protein [bacterium]
MKSRLSEAPRHGLAKSAVAVGHVESWREISLTEGHLQQLHRDLLRESTRDEHHRGRYKTAPNHVEAFDSAGRGLGVVFETATPFETPRLMESLARWTASALDDGGHHPLLVIAAFVVRFLAIHPFRGLERRHPPRSDGRRAAVFPLKGRNDRSLCDRGIGP